MPTILILEGNTPSLIASGNSGAAGFVRMLLALVPSLDLRVAAPHGGPIADGLLDGVDAFLFTGSGTSFAADAEEAAPQRALMTRALESGQPVWGSCNGLHLAALALGGEVASSPAGIEVGVAKATTVTTEGSSHPMMEGRANVFTAPTVHRDEVQRAPAGAVVVATNDHSAVQAMVYEQDGVDFWGTQYHPELAARDVAALYLRVPGIFHSHIAMAEDLEAADSDDAAAARLGTSVSALAVHNRARELVNWLAHVQRRGTNHRDA
jgi:GMP synthase (glutamine-hydrolysing)